MVRAARRAGVLACLLAASCGGSAAQPTAADLYTPGIREIVVEVAYVTGAEPATGPIDPVGDTWGILAANLRRLFEGGEKAIVVPTTLAEMNAIGDEVQPDYDLADVVRLADAHRRASSTGTTATFFVVFVPGYYRIDRDVAPDVLGAAVHGAGIIALFQPALRSVPIEERLRGIVEQLTVVHEVGHAAGLVNDGIPMATPHEDAAYPSHCVNQGCVMYYANEGALVVQEFIDAFLAFPSEVVFGPECLADADAASQSGALLPGR
jgi:hypothetical protein